MVVVFPGMSLVTHAFEEVGPVVDPAPGREIGPVVDPHPDGHRGERFHAVGGPGAFAHAADVIAAFDDGHVVFHLVSMTARHARHRPGPGIIDLEHIRPRRVCLDRSIDQPAPGVVRAEYIRRQRLVGQRVAGHAGMVADRADQALQLAAEPLLVEPAGAVSPGAALGNQQKARFVRRFQHVARRHRGRKPHRVEADPLVSPPCLRAALDIALRRLEAGRLGPAIVLANLPVAVAVAEAGVTHAVDRVVVCPLGVLGETEPLAALVARLAVGADGQVQPVQRGLVVLRERNVRPPVALAPQPPGRPARRSTL